MEWAKTPVVVKLLNDVSRSGLVESFTRNSWDKEHLTSCKERTKFHLEYLALEQLLHISLTASSECNTKKLGDTKKENYVKEFLEKQDLAKIY